MSTPTLVGPADPYSNPETPTEAPGTPNSTTTSLSAVSTTAIKDGHRGTAFPHASHSHHHRPSSNTLEAERADRISRLAGLERVSAGRPSSSQAIAGSIAGYAIGGQTPGYFDQNGNPIYTTKMSTVGSASATESITGRTTTWASGSQRAEGEEDGMSVETMDDRDRFSASAVDEDIDRERDGDCMSDDMSLVGFGEGAGSTVSGPIYVRGRAVMTQNQGGAGTPLTVDIERQRREARTNDSLAEDNANQGYFDTLRRGEGREQAERIMKEKLNVAAGKPLESPDEAGPGLGKFYFEEKK